jgi:hypothetical protein
MLGKKEIALHIGLLFKTMSSPMAFEIYENNIRWSAKRLI